MPRKLTEQQERYLDALFGEAKGSEVEAKRIAGYSENTSVTHIRNVLKDHIIERTRDALAGHAAKSALFYGKLLDNDEDAMIAAKEKLSAAKEVLDRIGITKTEKIDINASGGVFVLPAKDEIKD